jgi:hypothetical protein
VLNIRPRAYKRKWTLHLYGFSETFVALPSENPRLKPESNHAALTLGLKAELPRMNAGLPPRNRKYSNRGHLN